MNAIKDTIAKTSKAAVAGIFLAILVANLAVSLTAPQAAYAATVTIGKGLAISSAYITGASSTSPTFQQLKQAHFTLIGTVAYSSFTSYNWKQVANWIKSAHRAGFTTFINYWAKDAKTASDMTSQAASTGVDIIALDELLSTYHFSQKDLKATIDIGLKINPKLSFILNEFSVTDIQNAYAWTATYPSVRVATDNYYVKSVIDIGIQQASIYGKRPAAWLIFSKGSLDFDSYTHLNDWITYLKQKNIDTYFWIVDQAGTWTAQWQPVAAF